MVNKLTIIWIASFLAMTMLADRHCEWELKNQTAKNDNVCQPSLRACEAIQKH
jgi:hypothetical protein